MNFKQFFNQFILEAAAKEKKENRGKEREEAICKSLNSWFKNQLAIFKKNNPDVKPDVYTADLSPNVSYPDIAIKKNGKIITYVEVKMNHTDNLYNARFSCINGEWTTNEKGASKATASALIKKLNSKAKSNPAKIWLSNLLDFIRDKALNDKDFIEKYKSLKDTVFDINSGKYKEKADEIRKANKGKSKREIDKLVYQEMESMLKNNTSTTDLNLRTTTSGSSYKKGEIPGPLVNAFCKTQKNKQYIVKNLYDEKPDSENGEGKQLMISHYLGGKEANADFIQSGNDFYRISEKSDLKFYTDGGPDIPLIKAAAIAKPINFGFRNRDTETDEEGNPTGNYLAGEYQFEIKFKEIEPSPYSFLPGSGKPKLGIYPPDKMKKQTKNKTK